MAQQERADLHAAIEVQFPDNTDYLITPADVRGFLHGLVDSALLPASDTVAVDGYTRDEADDLLATKGSEQVQQAHEQRLDQQEQQLATIAVQGAPVYGFFKNGGAPFGYTSIDEAVADDTPKISYDFNVPVLVLTKSNPASGSGWAFNVNPRGRTLQLGENVVLTLPGDDSGTLTFENFYIESAPGARVGKVRLLTTAPASTPLPRLPRLAGYCGKTLEFVNGGAALLSGSYASIVGTGTVYALEPFKADNVAATITVIKVGSSSPALETYFALAFNSALALDFAHPAQILAVSNGVSFTAALGKVQGAQLRLFLYNTAGFDVSLAFPSAWVFLGPRPQVLGAGKRALLTLECATGATEADVFAGYATQV